MKDRFDKCPLSMKQVAKAKELGGFDLRDLPTKDETVHYSDKGGHRLRSIRHGTPETIRCIRIDDEYY